jgi:phospholipid-binding lipoprotein MlaA
MTIDAIARRGRSGRPLLLAIGLVLAACSTTPARTGAAVPEDVGREIDGAAADSRRNLAEEENLYAGLGNPELVATEERAARNRAERTLTATVVATVARHPDLADAIVARAGADAPQSAAAIAAAVHTAYPGLGRGGSGAESAGGTVPTSWYEPPPTYAPGPAAAGLHSTVQAAPAGQVPQSWYAQPALANLAGAPPLPQPPLPAGVAPAPARLVVPSTPAPAAPVVAAVAPEPAAPTHSVDPFEPMNRAFFAINEVADNFILRPVAWTYSFAPDFVKLAVRRAVANLNEPVVAANDLLQAEPRRAGTAVGRFVVNSTIGVLGFYDAADPLFDLKAHKSDFGQTLYSYGVEAGPYIVLPLFGPSDTRDAIGRAVDIALDPFTYLLNRNAMLARAGVTAVVAREELLKPLDELRAGSLDYYVSLRSSYLQNRQAELSGASPGGAAATDKATDELFNQAK